MSIYKNKNLLALKGKLFKFPTVLINYIADVFSNGWDRNRAIDSVGNHNNALMGGYLLAASNTTLSISGILTTDTIKALTKDGFVGSVTVNGTMSFSTGLKYGAFEVYRGTALIGRYCLTERNKLILQNQYLGLGILSYGIIGGTVTNVWQKSNAYYSETNKTGYSIAGTGWAAKSNGVGIFDANQLIPADLLNPTKCLAWVGGVQQDLQFVGKARNSISLIPPSASFNLDRYYIVPQAGFTTDYYSIECVIKPKTVTQDGVVYGYHGDPNFGSFGRCRQIVVSPNNKIYATIILITGISYTASLTYDKLYDSIILAKLVYSNSSLVLTVTNLITGETIQSPNTPMPANITMLSSDNIIGAVVRSGASYYYKGEIYSCKEYVGTNCVLNCVLDPYSTNMIDTALGRTFNINGTSTNLQAYIDMRTTIYNETGYEIWVNNTDSNNHRIYPLKLDGTRIITPTGYTLVETVTAGNMPSVADSRMSTFKYALANSYSVRQSVPEAFDTTDQCAPKLLTYPELSALSVNPKVAKIEVNGKITNLTIRQ